MKVQLRNIALALGLLMGLGIESGHANGTHPVKSSDSPVFKKDLLICKRVRGKLIPGYFDTAKDQLTWKKHRGLRPRQLKRLSKSCRGSTKTTSENVQQPSWDICISADFNNDSRIDFVDIKQLLQLLAKRDAHSDLNGDKKYNLVDLEIAERCVGEIAVQIASPTATPEVESSTPPEPSPTATPTPTSTSIPPTPRITDTPPNCLQNSSCLFVDGALTHSCPSGNYSISNRDCNGSDGNAVPHPQEIVGQLQPGSVVLIRSGTYNSPGVQGGRILNILDKQGTAAEPITIRNFPGENPHFVGNGSNWSIVLLELCSYITLRGLNISNGQQGLVISNSSYVTVQEVSVHHNSDRGLIIGKTSRGGSGQNLGAHHIRVQFSEIHTNGYSGLAIGDRLGTYPAYENIIEDTLTYNNGFLDADTGGSGALTLGGNPQPPINTHSNVFRRLVSFGNTSTQIGLQDTYSSSIEDSLLFYADIDNIIDPSGRRGDGRGMKFGTSMDSPYNGSHRFTGNVVFSNPHVGILIDSVVRSSEFYNNTIYFNGWAEWGNPGDYGYGGEFNSPTSTVKNNIFFNNRGDISQNSQGAFDYNLYGAAPAAFLSRAGEHSLFLQNDSDGDGVGDACDTDSVADSDGDTILDKDDLCPTTPDLLQTDGDGDGVGDACDRAPHSTNNNPERGSITCTADQDGDLWCDNRDNCPARYNPVDPMFQNSTLGRKHINTEFPPESTIAERLEQVRSQVSAQFSLRTRSPAIDRGQVIGGFHCARSDDNLVNPYPADDPNCHHWNGSAPDLGALEGTN